jgi:hypothetical protein
MASTGVGPWHNSSGEDAGIRKNDGRRGFGVCPSLPMHIRRPRGRSDVGGCIGANEIDKNYLRLRGHDAR